MNLTENFTLEELLYSDIANKLGIKNVPTELHKNNLKHTAQYLLEPLRTLLNEKYKTYCQKKVKQVVLKITSGYRSALLNSKIKGASKTSQHCEGCACDAKAIIVFVDNSKKELPYTSLYEDIKAWTRAGRMIVDQCIQEKSGGSVWCHVSLKSQLKDCRKQFLKYNGLTYKLDAWYK